MFVSNSAQLTRAGQLEIMAYFISLSLRLIHCDISQLSFAVFFFFAFSSLSLPRLK